MNFIRKYSLMMLLLTGAMTIVSCSNDTEEFNAQERRTVTFTANAPVLESDTRTYLDENEQPMWHGEEDLKVYSNAYSDYPFMFNMVGRYPAKKASFVINRDQEDTWFDYYDSENTKYYAVVHGPQGCYFDSANEQFVMRHGIGESGEVDHHVLEPKVQNLVLGNISSEDDILVGQKIMKNEMDPNAGEFKIRFKRYTGIMKIHLVDDDNMLEEGYQAVTGWISTGRDPYGNEDPELYNTNNFGGRVKIGMGEDNLYKLTKDDCTGLQLGLALGNRYFYDFNGRTEAERNIYISVLPTKLNVGDYFTFVLGNGAGKVIMKKIKVEAPMEIKSCHIHDITIHVKRQDIFEGNPFK